LGLGHINQDRLLAVEPAVLAAEVVAKKAPPSEILVAQDGPPRFEPTHGGARLVFALTGGVTQFLEKFVGPSAPDWSTDRNGMLGVNIQGATTEALKAKIDQRQGELEGAISAHNLECSKALKTLEEHAVLKIKARLTALRAADQTTAMLESLGLKRMP